MKKKLVIGLVAVGILSIVVALSAKDYPLAQLRSTTSATLYSVSLGTAGAVTGTSVNLDVEHCTYHTFQMRVTCTNEVVTTLDRTLDGVAWVRFHTNTVTATATNDTTLVGKWLAVRANSVGTNATVAVLYLCQ